MRRTKIVCTIGPASEKIDTIKELVREGMDVARLNFSHGTLEEHRQRIANLRQAESEYGRKIGILIDTRGAEIRLGDLEQKEVELQDGACFILATDRVVGNIHKAGVNYRDLPAEVKPGDTILIDDGLIELRVEQVLGREVQTTVVHGGKLAAHKSVNLPGVPLKLPPLSDDDRRDIELALEQGVDFIAASFIRRADDILAIRRLLEKESAGVKIIAKIENFEGVENFSEILEAADGVMIARGDLGVDIPAEDVPLVQKRLIKQCNRAGKPVITATQMLDSMIRNPRPTRAEASDVANAIFDGTDAVMLSGETASGSYPLEAVSTMARIASRAEEDLDYQKILQYNEPASNKSTTDAISYATCRAAQELGARAIISATQSGHTARMVSKYRPRAPIIAATPNEKVAAILNLTWGVYPLLCPPTPDSDEIFNAAVSAALEAELIHNGDLVILTAGVPVGVPGTTNFMRIDTVGEIILQGTGVGKKAATGTVFIAEHATQTEAMEEGQILVAPFTDKDYYPVMEKASAIITEAGGLTSHAAIVGLNLGIPVVVGVELATQKLTTGQLITVDTPRGIIYHGRATV